METEPDFPGPRDSDNSNQTGSRLPTPRRVSFILHVCTGCVCCTGGAQLVDGGEAAWGGEEMFFVGEGYAVARLSLASRVRM